jgi:formylglycine-generating enzyme
MKKVLGAAVMGMLLVFTTAGWADVFNMGGTRNLDGSWTGLASLETVPVGDPGNAPDTRYATLGYGSVGYTYSIGKYEITAGQYCEFLNAVAKTDPYGLYNTNMNYDLYPGGRGCNIKRTNSSGNYEYTVDLNWANRPVNYVSFWDACRFANWLHNGQGDGNTETGAYALTPEGITNNTVTRNDGWKWAVTSEDEWYKAAYYKGGSADAGYYDYPTSNDSVPGRDMAETTNPGNNANANYNSSGYLIGSPYYRTVVGEFELSDSPYETFDQGGNVWEWNEAIITSSLRGQRGGSFQSSDDVMLSAWYQGYIVPTDEYYNSGFRVSEVPEPASMAVLALGGIWMLVRRRGVGR